MTDLRRSYRALSLPIVLAGSSVVACGSPPPAAPTTSATATSPVATSKGKPIDVSPVPEPAGLVVVGRVSKPSAIVAAVASWTRLPLPSGPDLVRSLADESIAAVVDLSQPVDAAVYVGSSRGGIEPLAAFSVTVKDYEQAKVKLGEAHRLVAGDNGQFKVSGLGSKKRPSPMKAGPQTEDRSEEGADEEDEEEEDDDSCVLAPAPQGGRLVCGESAALDALVPYLSRTMPRKKWASDVHVEVRPEPVRAPLQDLRASLPILAHSLLGSQSTTVRDLVDATMGELVDIANDTQKLSIDAQIAESGAVTNTRLEFQSTTSLMARLAMAPRGDAPPAGFWHLPAETDMAFFGRGADPKLFDRPRELIGGLMLEATGSAGMPEAERRALKDLVTDRVLSLFTSGTNVYGKGFDQAAVEKAAANLKGIKVDDRAGRAEAERLLVEQIVGWHLYQVNEPVAKVGPVLRDWSTLWNRPTFAKWAKSKSSAAALPRMRVAPVPAGVALPKETVHLEITIPREDLDDESPLHPANAAGATPKKPVKTKKIARKPIVAHVFAVPDGAATWLAFGLDAKLVAQRAGAALASAPDANTLGKVAGLEELREGKLNTGGFVSVRSFLFAATLDESGETSWIDGLRTLPHKGSTPVLFTGWAEAPSPEAKAGASVGTMHISRAIIEDIVKLAMSR